VRALALLIIGLVAAAAWLASQQAVEHARERPSGAAAVRADYQRCISINPGPLTAPAPGKVRQNYHTRDGGFA
jgi:hypothetical protein